MNLPLSHRQRNVKFADSKLLGAYKRLHTGRTEERRLAKNIDQAISNLKHDPEHGIKIPSQLWPNEYVRKYGINNLRKYNLPYGWRLVYTIRGNEVEIVTIILEWFPHKEYERRFNYKSK